MRLFKVTSVEPDSPAAAAGIQIGDFIASVDGRAVSVKQEIDEATQPSLHNLRSRSFTLVIYRAAERLNVTLGRGYHGLVGESQTYDSRSQLRAKYEPMVAAHTRSLPDFFKPIEYSNLLINVDEPLKFVECLLVGANADHLSVVFKDALIVLPYTSILQIRKTDNNSSTSVLLRHQVIYKGSSSIGVGFTLPI